MHKNDILKRAKEYVEKETFSEFKKEVEDLISKSNEDELFERFYKDIEFGTSGLRGVIGGGYNNMNPYIVSRATQGFATYMLKEGYKDANGDISVAIAYDSRHYSTTFSQVVASVFAGNGIKVKLFKKLRPTPQLSFAIKKFNLSGGVILTASHNPPKYNGYKVYWSDGGSIVPPHDNAITKEVENVDKIKSLDFEQALKSGMVEYFDDSVDKAFVENTKEVLVRKDLFLQNKKDVKIVYTPLHGTGSTIVDLLKADLDLNLLYVPEQKEPNGDFPTVDYPNPEEEKALKMAIDLAKVEKADIVIASDPDADRIGIVLPKDDNSGEFELVSGNIHGILLLDYILNTLKEKNQIPKNAFFVNTIVTTELQNKIADKFGVANYRVLTGFKWIAAKMSQELKKGGEFLLGCEESYGFLLSKNIFDKDSFTALLLTIEMLIYYKSQNKSLLIRLEEIYKEYGYHLEKQLAKTFEGASGLQKISTLMENFRKNPPKTIAGVKVDKIVDIKESYSLNLQNQKKETIDLPKSNVLQFYLEDTSLICLRPSGTEPKIKYYFNLVAKDKKEMSEKMKMCFEEFEKFSS